jgi:hypothetical protein
VKAAFSRSATPLRPQTILTAQASSTALTAVSRFDGARRQRYYPVESTLPARGGRAASAWSICRSLSSLSCRRRASRSHRRHPVSDDRHSGTRRSRRCRQRCTRWRVRRHHAVSLPGIWKGDGRQWATSPCWSSCSSCAPHSRKCSVGETAGFTLSFSRRAGRPTERPWRSTTSHSRSTRGDFRPHRPTAPERHHGMCRRLRQRDCGRSQSGLILPDVYCSTGLVQLQQAQLQKRIMWRPSISASLYRRCDGDRLLEQLGLAEKRTPGS